MLLKRRLSRRTFSPWSRKVRKYQTEPAARDYARKFTLRYGKAVTDSFWYVGTMEQLRQLPLIEIKKP